MGISVHKAPLCAKPVKIM